MKKILLFILLFASVIACKQQPSGEALTHKLDSLKLITAATDSTLKDSILVDSISLKKEIKDQAKDAMKEMKDTLKEVIVKVATEKIVGSEGKNSKKNIKQDSFEELTGMDIKYAGVSKNDTINKVVYLLATFSKEFEGKLKLKAFDKNKKEVKKAQKVKGKYVKTDKTIDHASVFVNQDALSQNTLAFAFDELPSVKEIDYFEISVLK